MNKHDPASAKQQHEQGPIHKNEKAHLFNLKSVQCQRSFDDFLPAFSCVSQHIAKLLQTYAHY